MATLLIADDEKNIRSGLQLAFEGEGYDVLTAADGSEAWEKVQNGEANPLRNEMAADNRILEYLTKDEILSLLDASSYTGEAEKRTMKVVQEATRPR